MRTFSGISGVLPDRVEPRSYAALERLAHAYTAFFNGVPTKEDCEIILVDLAQFTGYYNTTPADTDPMICKQYEGMRSVMERVMRFANPPLQEMNSLHQSAQAELNINTETETEL